MPSENSVLDDPEMIDVRQVAAMLHCSTRHVYRLADAGQMPKPCKLGRLVRWRWCALQEWVADGCHPIQDLLDVNKQIRKKT